jgi:hypothetical protein
MSPAPNKVAARWRKSTCSAGNGACVEVADLQVTVGVRDSKDPQSQVLEFTRGAWQDFIASARHGSFDR